MSTIIYQPINGSFKKRSYELVLPSGNSLLFGSLCEVIGYMCDYSAGSQNRSHANETEIWTTDGHSLNVVQRYHHFGVQLTQENGTAKDIVDALLAEIRSFACNENGKPKSPWEMSRQQWNAVAVIGNIAYGLVPLFAESHRKESFQSDSGTETNLLGYASQQFRKLFGWSFEGPTYNEMGETNGRHEIHIENALARGDAVPESVIFDYLNNYSDIWSKERALKDLLHKPYLRGKLPMSKLQTLLSLLASKDSCVSEVTQENVESLVALAATASSENLWLSMDNVLYKNGILKVWKINPKSAVDAEYPYNDFALVHRAILLEHRRSLLRQQLESRKALYGVTLREVARVENEIEEVLPVTVNFNFSNEIARQIEKKNLKYLLMLLDSSTNEASQRAVQAHFGIKLRGVKALERERGIYQLCGFDTEDSYRTAKAAFEAERAAERRAEEEKRRHADEEFAIDKATRQVKAQSVVFEGAKTTLANVIELLIERGFTEFSTVKRGAVSQFVMKHADGRFLKLKNADGSAIYAKSLLSKKPNEAMT